MCACECFFVLFEFCIHFSVCFGVSPRSPGVACDRDPAAGPPLLGRVCGRKRLSVQQKKRSYSEPDSLHEVGVSDPETSALFRRGGTAGIIY